MESERIDTDIGPIFRFIKDSVVFTIMFGGNGDLYWGVDNLENEDTLTHQEFAITKENMTLFNLFVELYERIANCAVFDLDEVKMEEAQTPEEVAAVYESAARSNDHARRSGNYQELFKEGVITWISDDRDAAAENLVQVVKEDERFVIHFYKALREDSREYWLFDNQFVINVRFRNSGSYYNPFNTVFMRMYNGLKDYYPEHHQYHLEELLYEDGQGRK